MQQNIDVTEGQQDGYEAPELVEYGQIAEKTLGVSFSDIQTQ